MPVKKAPEGDPRRCENCLHFYQHYHRGKLPPYAFIKSKCGHCRFQFRRTVKPEYVCENFEYER